MRFILFNFLNKYIRNKYDIVMLIYKFDLKRKLSKVYGKVFNVMYTKVKNGQTIMS